MLSASGQGRSRGPQDGEHGRGPTEEEHSAAVCGDMLVVTGAGAEDVSEFIVPPAEPGRGSGTFEAAPRSVSAFEAAVILFQPVVEVAAGPVPHPFAELGPDRTGGAVVTVGSEPIGGEVGGHPGRAEEGAG